jgi:hypothetical protein
MTLCSVHWIPIFGLGKWDLGYWELGTGSGNERHKNANEEKGIYHYKDSCI